MAEFLDAPVNAVRQGDRGQAVRLVHDNAPLPVFIVFRVNADNVKI